MAEIQIGHSMADIREALLRPDVQLLASVGKRYREGSIFDRPPGEHVYFLSAADGSEVHDPRRVDIQAVLRMCADGRFNGATYETVLKELGLSPEQVAVFALASGGSQVGERRTLATQQVAFLTDKQIFPKVQLFVDTAHLDGCAGFCRDVGRNTAHLHEHLAGYEAEALGLEIDDETGIERTLHLLTMRANRRVLSGILPEGIEQVAFVAQMSGEHPLVTRVPERDFNMLVADEVVPAGLRRLVD